MPKAINFTRFFLCFFVSVFFLFPADISYGNEFEDSPDDVMISYFQALKSGDIPKLISLLADPLLKEKRDILEEDTIYPEFLRDYYKDATMSVADTKFTDDSSICIVTTHIFFQSGKPLKIKFYLKKTESGWKITHEESITQK